MNGHELVNGTVRHHKFMHTDKICDYRDATAWLVEKYQEFDNGHGIQ